MHLFKLVAELLQYKLDITKWCFAPCHTVFLLLFIVQLRKIQVRLLRSAARAFMRWSFGRRLPPLIALFNIRGFPSSPSAVGANRSHGQFFDNNSGLAAQTGDESGAEGWIFGHVQGFDTQPGHAGLQDCSVTLAVVRPEVAFLPEPAHSISQTPAYPLFPGSGHAQHFLLLLLLLGFTVSCVRLLAFHPTASFWGVPLLLLLLLHLSSTLFRRIIFGALSLFNRGEF